MFEMMMRIVGILFEIEYSPFSAVPSTDVMMKRSEMLITQLQIVVGISGIAYRSMSQSAARRSFGRIVARENARHCLSLMMQNAAHVKSAKMLDNT